MQTTDVENFPGFPDGVLGPELMDSMRKQAERFGAEFITDDASRVELTGDVKRVWIGETEYRSRAVILSTGSAWRPLGVPGEKELLGHGVSSCAACARVFFRGPPIPVLCGGGAAGGRVRPPPAGGPSPPAGRGGAAAQGAGRDSAPREAGPAPGDRRSVRAAAGTGTRLL